MKLYLSFTPEDALYAQLVRAALSGYTLYSGALSQIAECDQFLAIITPRYANDLTCSAERRAAQAHDVPIVALIVEHTALPAELSDVPQRPLETLWQDFLKRFRAALHLPDPAVAALVSEGRALLEKAPELARERLEQALQLAPNDPLAQAALGDYFRVAGDLERARAQYQQALTHNSPDGHIGLGLLAEMERAWLRADDHYADALSALGKNAAALSALRQFNRPQSGNLYLQAVRALRYSDLEAALRAADRALALGVRDDTNYPERIAHRLRAEVLEALGRAEEAAEAYFEAGKRFLWLDQYAVAADLLRAACRLKPDHAAAHWFLANALLGVAALPHYPFADEAVLREGETALQTGLALRLPEPEYAWAYDVRALQCESRARLPDQDAESLRWQAVAFLERGLVLNEGDPYRWQALNRVYRALGLERLAMDAARRAAQLGDDSALEDSIITLTNAGQFDEALPLLKRFRARQPSLWAEAVQAYIHVHQERPDLALELIGHVIETTERLDAWYLGVRADAYRLLGDYERAADTYRYLWEQRDSPLYAADSNGCGWSGLVLGYAEQALPYLERALRQDSESPTFIYANIGFAYLALGEFEQAQAAFAQAVELMTNSQQHWQLIRLDIPTVRYLSVSWEHAESAKAILDTFEARLNERLAEIGQPLPLTALLESLDIRSEDSWQFVGQQASLGRLYMEAGQHEAAAQCYQRLLAEPERFPEAGTCLSDALAELVKAADERFKEGDTNAALERYRALAEYLPDDAGFQGELRARIACARLAQGKPHVAEFNAAVKRLKAANVPSIGAALAQACLALATNVPFIWQLAEVRHSLPPDVASDFLAALLRHLDQLFRLPESSARRFPLVVPILIDFAPSLLTLSGDLPSDLLERKLPDLRTRLIHETGVPLPGIRLSVNETLPVDAYLIHLDEVPVALDFLPAGTLFCEESPETLRIAGIGIQREAIQPLSRVRGAWINRSDASRARMLRLRVLDDPFDYLALHLEAILRQALPSLLSWQALNDLLSEWQPERTFSTAERTILLQLGRLLLRDGLPLRPDLLDALRESNFEAAFRAARLAVRDALPRHLPRLPLPPEVEALLAQHLVADSPSYLAMPPQVVQNILAALRTLIPPDQERAALVLSDWRLCISLPFLTRYEFPYLVVLTQEELDNDSSQADSPA
ncbi:MAG: FHIPEP family type III secretion protein [Anaerolineae bacterium]|nr:FHIPEP family type III secretion protein [Anaerolineae bacterium]